MGSNKTISLSAQREAALKVLKQLEKNLIEGLITTRKLGDNAEYFQEGTSAYAGAKDQGFHKFHQAQVAFLGEISKAIKDIEADTLRRGGYTTQSDFPDNESADSLAAQYQYIATQGAVFLSMLTFNVGNPLADLETWKAISGDAYMTNLGTAITQSAALRDEVKNPQPSVEQGAMGRSRSTTSGGSNASSSSSTSTTSTASTVGSSSRERTESMVDSDKELRGIAVFNHLISEINAHADKVGTFRLSGSKATVDKELADFGENKRAELSTLAIMKDHDIKDATSLLKEAFVHAEKLGLKMKVDSTKLRAAVDPTVDVMKRFTDLVSDPKYIPTSRIIVLQEVFKMLNNLYETQSALLAEQQQNNITPTTYMNIEGVATVALNVSVLMGVDPGRDLEASQTMTAMMAHLIQHPQETQAALSAALGQREQLAAQSKGFLGLGGWRSSGRRSAEIPEPDIGAPVLDTTRTTPTGLKDHKIVLGGPPKSPKQ